MVNTKHTHSDFIMKMKKLCGIAKNYGYLEEDLPEEYFKEFLVQLVSVFKEDIEKVGFKKFVLCEFRKAVETLKEYEQNES